MKFSLRPALAATLALALSAASLCAAHAQTIFSVASATTLSSQDHPFDESVLPTASNADNGPFSPWKFLTPPGAEGYEVNQVREEDLSPAGLADWHPTDNPKGEIIPGQMRSDRESIPENIDKAEADRAEISEARLAETATRSARAAAGCRVYWPAPFEVCAAINEVYQRVGGPSSFLSLPRSNELTNPDGAGKRTEFINGFIYWHPSTGAHTVSLPVSKVWQRHGWERGFLGYPTSSDIAQGNGWYRQDFQGGHVYSHNALPPSQASIQGTIFDKWQSMGAQNSELGFLISDELPTPDGIGHYNFFEHGAIYWTPQHGAHPVTGTILADWARSGYEKGPSGFPIEDSVIAADNVGVTQRFEHGTLHGYVSVIQQLVDDMPGLPGAVGAQRMYQDGAAYAKSVGRTNLLAVFLEALNELRTYNALYELETAASNIPSGIAVRGGLPDGDDSDPINPLHRGDIFYSDAVTARYNHGHNGIFVGNLNDDTKNDTVEASGVINSASLSDEDDSQAGVKKHQNWHNDDPLRKNSPRLRNPQNQYVATTQEHRNKAADWALEKAGDNYSEPGAGYNYNFAFNKDVDAERFNCSSLVWAAYMHASNNTINLDSNGGPGVYPLDIKRSSYVKGYDPEETR